LDVERRLVVEVQKSDRTKIRAEDSVIVSAKIRSKNAEIRARRLGQNTVIDGERERESIRIEFYEANHCSHVNAGQARMAIALIVAQICLFLLVQGSFGAAM
jgi:hypothetical protein